MDRVLKFIKTGEYTTVILFLVTAFTLFNLKSAEGTFINGRDGAGTITCNSLGQSAPAIMDFTSIGKNGDKGPDGSYNILSNSSFTSNGGIDNVNSVNKTFYNLTYHGTAKNCPPSDIKINSTISGTCGQSASVKFISKVITGEFVANVNCAN